MTIGVNSSAHLFDTSFNTDGVLYSAASGVVTSTVAGDVGQIFTGTGAGSAPTWSPSPLISSTGVFTNVNQPCFVAYLSTTSTNVTGDGTTVPVVFDASITNQGADYNTTTGFFTAPVTGNYLFTYVIAFNGLSGSAATQAVISIGGTDYAFVTNQIDNLGILAPSPSAQSGSVLLSLGSSDTINFNVQVSGTTKTIGLLGGSPTTGLKETCMFSGVLIC